MSTTFVLNKTNVKNINITPKNSTQAVSLNYVQDTDANILWYSGEKVYITTTYRYYFDGEKLDASYDISTMKKAGANTTNAVFTPTLKDPTTVETTYSYGPITPELGNVWGNTTTIESRYVSFEVEPSYLDAEFAISDESVFSVIYPGTSLSVTCAKIILRDAQTGGLTLNSLDTTNSNFNTVYSYIKSGLKYQWYQDDPSDDSYTIISGATNSSYIVKEADIGYKLRCIISFNGTDNVADTVDDKDFYIISNFYVYNNKLSPDVFQKGTVGQWTGSEYSMDYGFGFVNGYFFKQGYYFTMSGTTSAVDAGTYYYTVTPINGVVWSDTGTRYSRTFTWTISKAAINKNSYYQKDDLEYTGSTLYLTLSSTSYVTVSGTTSAVNSGYYTAYITPDSNHQWSDGTTSAYALEWSIDTLYITMPRAVTGLVYDASYKFGITGINTTYYYSDGTTGATSAGSYSATFTIMSSYGDNVYFVNGSQTYTVNWSIAKGTITNDMIIPEISASSSGVFGWCTVRNISTYDATTLKYTGKFRRKTSASGSIQEGSNTFTAIIGVPNNKVQSSWTYNSSHYYGFRVYKITGNDNWNDWSSSSGIGSGWNK